MENNPIRGISFLANRRAYITSLTVEEINQASPTELRNILLHRLTNEELSLFFLCCATLGFQNVYHCMIPMERIPFNYIVGALKGAIFNGKTDVVKELLPLVLDRVDLEDEEEYSMSEIPLHSVKYKLLTDFFETACACGSEGAARLFLDENRSERHQRILDLALRDLGGAYIEAAEEGHENILNLIP